MRINVLKLVILLALIYGCYDPQDDITSLEEAEFVFLDQADNLLADGFSEYLFEIKLPGVRNGSPKSISLNSTWGTWINDSSSINSVVEYNSTDDAYSGTFMLKAARDIGPFSIQLDQDEMPLKTLNLEAKPKYPEQIQILSDSISMQLIPGNTTQLKALFFNEVGFPSDNIKYEFETEASVNIFPNEIFIQSSATTATLQISTETVIDTIKIYGRIPDLEEMQPAIDTLKIAIINQ